MTQETRLDRVPWLTAVLCLSLLLNSTATAADLPPSSIQFNRDIRPILSENCFYCHGQDPSHRKADLRLDQRDSVTRQRKGRVAIVPADTAASDLILRITSDDPEKRMPPPDSNHTLTAAQIALLTQWVSAGAAYERHWSFEPPTTPPSPSVRQSDWPRNDIDRFVLAKLEALALHPSHNASPQKWLRRASLDLIGLPPTIKELDDFLADEKEHGEAAYAVVADRLLASPRLGERLAIDWLDAARYADTHGFNNDSARTMWRWRDWVIEAFNTNKPYDRFITEQLAGDLLPNATTEQRLATGFCRNHVINSEGGIIDEEYRVEYVADRVRTMSMAWLGLTTECCRCHDHKFDPFTQKDYYRLFAFFNNVPELGEDGRVANAVPLMPAPTHEQAAQLAAIAKDLAELNARLEQAHKHDLRPATILAGLETTCDNAAAHHPRDESFSVNFDDATGKPKAWSFPTKPPKLAHGIRGRAWIADGEGPLAKFESAAFTPNNKTGGTVLFWLKTDPSTPNDAPLLSNLNHEGSPADAQYGKGAELRLVDGEIEFRASDRFPAYSMRVRSDGAALKPSVWRHVAIVYTPPATELPRTPASVVQMFIDGRELPTRVLNDGLGASGVAAKPWLVAADNSPGGRTWRGMLDEWHAFARPLKPEEIRAILLPELRDALKAQPDVAELRQIPSIASFAAEQSLATTDDTVRDLLSRGDRIRAEYLALRRDVPLTMVMTELSPPRQAHVLIRGAYNAPGEAVEAGVPESVTSPWPKDAPANRLGLANWLTSPNHPLVGRVVVNRFWAQFFGTGIVKTMEDFGTQGEYPGHPELLDYLARRFVDSGWNVKSLLRMIVLSSTYRQDSDVTPQLLERDPENRLLARGPRFRLPAEVLRDQALAVSGLLRNRLGGPSVHPYQPQDLYKGIVVGANYPGTSWQPSTGDDLYRRSLYTFWKRTVPHPLMLTLDAPDREFCSVRRSRTNTPLQALTLMNEPGMVEAARSLGVRMLKEGGPDDASRCGFAFRLVMARPPSAQEAALLCQAWDRFRREYREDPKAATDLLTVGAARPPKDLDPSELAAASMVANVLLNLDEAVTKD